MNKQLQFPSQPNSFGAINVNANKLRNRAWASDARNYSGRRQSFSQLQRATLRELISRWEMLQCE